MADEAALRRRLAQSKRDREANERRTARLLKEAEEKAAKEKAAKAAEKDGPGPFSRAVDLAASAFGLGTGKAISKAEKAIRGKK